MKILIISDAWRPQLNGVVRTYEDLGAELISQGHDVKIIGPADFKWRMPMPGYREIELVLLADRPLAGMIDEFAPETIHIATEGPLGQAAQRYCARRGYKFVTCYHTHFPDYFAKRVGKYLPFLYGAARKFAIRRVRKFHDAATAVMVATKSLEDDLKAWKFAAPLKRLTRGVNIKLFKPGKGHDLTHLMQDKSGDPALAALYVGRVAIEKNLEDFLEMDWPGLKIIIGDGPDRAHLEEKYKEVCFLGKKQGEDLVDYYRASDVFVFPSRTDTFGLVLIEALACGVPVAGYNVTGPKDIVTEDFLGAVHENDLSIAAHNAHKQRGSAKKLHDFVKEHYTWEVAAKQFVDIQKKALIKKKTSRSG